MRISDWSSDVCSSDLLSKAIAPDDANFPYRFVPRATLTRRKSASAPKLTLDEGNRVAAVAKVWEFAMEIYRDEERAREFLYRQHPMLENQKPIDVATDTGVGADLVINLLGRAAYRSEEHTSELQSLMRISYAVFC